MSKIKIHKVARFSYKYPVSPEVRIEAELTRTALTGFVIHRLTTTIFGERMKYEIHIPTANEDEIVHHLIGMVTDDVRQRILKFNK